MYYQNYYPYSNNYQTQPQQQGYYNGVQQGFQSQMNNLSVAQVNGLEGAKTYVVLPNQTFFLFDSNNNSLYVKSVDNQGKCNLDIYTKYKEPTKQDESQIALEERIKRIEEILYAKQQSNASASNVSTSSEQTTTNR